jgi:subtilisin family serine protease
MPGLALTLWLGCRVLPASAAPLLLRHATIDTSMRTHTVATPRGEPSARGTLPYLVQCRGPIQEHWKTALQQAGGTVRNYMPDFAFLVDMAPTTAATIVTLPFVHWLGEYQPDYKYGRMCHNTRGMLTVTITTFADTDTACVAARVRAVGGAERARAGAANGVVRAHIPASSIAALAAMAEVEWLEPYVAPILLNDVAVQAPRMNVHTVWTNYGLTGKGQIVAVADTGLDNGTNNATLHPDFTNRVHTTFALGRANDWSDPDGHGTHVCGSLLGNGSASAGQFKGVAYEAQLIMQSTMDAGGYLILPSDINVLFMQTYTNGARIHSDSWGSSTFGEYTASSRQADEFMWHHKDALLIFAAGNDGADLDKNGVIDLDAIASPASAKNVLTVGAAENERAPGSGGLTSNSWGAFARPMPPISVDFRSAPYDGIHHGMAAFSSRGPCDDGRNKPDVVAPGTDIISCRSRHPAAGAGWGLYAPNSNYLFMGGTSMATPLTAGAAALVRQFFIERAGITNPSAALIKATLIGGARPMAPGQYGLGDFLEIPPAPRPNNVEGWGHVNLAGTLFPTGGRTNVVYDHDTLTTGATNTYLFTVSATNALCITLAWTDYPGALAAQRALVNDLDLLVTLPHGLSLRPRGLATPDRVNNVEGVDVWCAAPGTYTIRVIGYNVPYGPQSYALVIHEAPARRPITVTPTALIVTTDIGTAVTAALTISNAPHDLLCFDVFTQPTGYQWLTNGAVGAPAFAWLDITNGGTRLPLSFAGNTQSELLPIGFPFPFFGRTHAQFLVSMFGALAFSNSYISGNNMALPTDAAAPDPFIAPLWLQYDGDDTNYQVWCRATSTNLAITWLNMPYLGASTLRQTFQTILHSNGTIVFQYKTVKQTASQPVLTYADKGIQSARMPHGAGLNIMYARAVTNNMAITITPPTAPWLVAAPATGVIAAAATRLLHITADTSNLITGTYHATAVVRHSDAYTPTLQIPITVQVVPEPATMWLLLLPLARCCRSARPGRP